MKIVDEFTGRIMEGRRWSEGLHQAIEAKEGVRIQEENQTLATITLQNYFRLYEKLAGMTGTAKTEEKEFVEIYDLHVVEIPTNVPVARADENDFIFKSKDAKFAAVVDDIAERHEKGQPVLVGTIAVETSEYLAELLKRRGVPHNVLNAKEHERESEIIKDAGQPGAVTIATNMAGRGVDIKLGEGVVDVGGLYVLATERHESRRIDNQLRGRSGRQGDPGETRFYLSAQDDLVRLFAGDRIHGIMERFKLPDDQPMEAGILSRQIEGAQKKVEEQNFVARKNVLKYDDVMNTQRQVIYEQRRRVLEGEDLSEDVRAWIEEVVEVNVANATEAEFVEDWDLEPLVQQMQGLYGTDITLDELKEEVELDRDALTEEFVEDALDTYAEKEKELGPELMRELERVVILQVVDTRWRAHLDAHGLPARRHPPARDGAEGSARRVPRRGPHHVRGAQPDDPRGGRPHALPCAGQHRARAAAARPGAERQPAVRTRDHGGRRRDRRRRCRRGRHGHRSRPAACARRADPGHGRERRSAERRAQRPLLVRQRQEVQEVPRRVAAHVRDRDPARPATGGDQSPARLGS